MRKKNYKPNLEENRKRNNIILTFKRPNIKSEN